MIILTTRTIAESKLKKENIDKCPIFEGKKEDYQEWQEKVNDCLWTWKEQKIEGYPGFKLRGALKGEPWEQVAQEEGIQTILDILDQKYGRDRKQ